MVSAYSEQFEALWEAGIDILQIETCQDILQVKAALYAANTSAQNIAVNGNGVDDILTDNYN